MNEDGVGSDEEVESGSEDDDEEGSDHGDRPFVRINTDYSTFNQVKRQTLSQALYDHEKGHESLVPIPVAKVVLFEYVLNMQRSLPDRIEKWKQDLEDVEFSLDVKKFIGAPAFGSTSTSKTRKQSTFLTAEETKKQKEPKSFYLDMDEIDALLFETIEKQRLGEYRHVMQSIRRILKTSLRMWVKAMEWYPPNPSPVPPEKGGAQKNALQNKPGGGRKTLLPGAASAKIGLLSRGS